MILSINTADSLVTKVSLQKGDIEISLEEKTDHTKSQNVLPLIEKLLKQENVTLQDLTGIEVHTGPGSFTGVRVGVTVANTLAWALGIPVNNQKSPALPIYEPSKFDDK